MRLDTKRGPEVEMSPGLQSHSFQIKTSAKAFQALLSNLYSDKISAIVREISSNAWDAHKEVSKENEPFFVRVPSHFDPRFVVQDYGPGLSDKDVRGLYTTLFDSTKENTNDALGAYGLGSKTPFAYTDAFTIRSRHDGVENAYTAFMDEHGTPQIVHIGSTKTNETGFTVEVPVDTQDVEKWQEKAKGILADFPVTPEIEGVELSPVQYTLSGYNWGITTRHSPWNDRKKKFYGRSSFGKLPDVHVILGVVRYAVTQSMLKDIIGNSNDMRLSNFFKKIDGDIDLLFNIGDLLVDVSRENLDDSENTRSKIHRGLLTCINELNERIQEEAHKHPDVHTAYAALMKKFSSISRIVADSLDSGQIVCQDGPVPNCIPFKFKYTKVRLRHYNGAWAKKKFYDTDVFYIHKNNNVVFLKDVPGGDQAANKFAEDNPNVSVYLIQFSPSPQKKIKTRHARRYARYFGKVLRGIDVKLASEYPRSDATKKRQTPEVFNFTSVSLGLVNEYMAQNKFWRDEYNDVPESGVYILLRRFVPHFDNDKYFRDGLKGLNRVVRTIQIDLGQCDFALHGVRPSKIEKYRKDENWISFDEYMDRFIQENLRDIEDRLIYLELPDRLKKYIAHNQQNIKGIDSTLDKVIDFVVQFEGTMALAKSYQELLMFSSKEIQYEHNPNYQNYLKLKQSFPILFNILEAENIDLKSIMQLEKEGQNT